ncbi:hypothetical protein F5Y09DRAFT_355402 [Xylaria sp. FL1042]|nr:hypothetical protein F5Y09DRAFT_355402 [Xylaria sp. FL1042]
MSLLNRHTVFVDDASLDNHVEGDVPWREATPREVLTHQTRRGVIDQTTALAEDKPPPTRSKFPIKRTSEEGRLVPVVTGSPWKHYESRYRVKYGFSFGIITSRDRICKQLMIRTISGRNTDEQIQNIRQFCHDNIVKNIEIYECSDSSYFLISEFIPISLMHLCRAPVYPNEPQFSSILHQIYILTGVEFLLACDFVHEQLSCANILVNFDGNIKICDVEYCKRSDNIATLSDLFSRLIIRLINKKKNTAAAVGLIKSNNWSDEAVDLFTLTTTNSNIKQLLNHKFIRKRNKKKLVWLIPFVVENAEHSTE